MFLIETNETFMIEHIFYLDNKMGMKEKVSDLILMDFLLKDRERFVINFSGYIRINTLDNI